MTRTPTVADLHGFERRLLAELTDVVVERRASAASTTSARSAPARVAGASSLRGTHARRAIGLGAGLAAAAAALVALPNSGLLPSSGRSVVTVAAGQSLRIGSYSVDPGGGDSTRRAADVAAALRKLGVRVREVPEPASPSLVGRVTTFEVPDGAGIHWSSGDTDQTLLVDPGVYEGTVVLNVGTKAGPGQRYGTAASAFDRGEVLAGLPCAVGWPMPPAAVETAAAKVGQRVVWEVDTPGSNGASDVTEPTDRPDGLVSYVQPETPESVRAVVVPRGAPPAAGASDPRSALTCTPALGARWR